MADDQPIQPREQPQPTPTPQPVEQPIAPQGPSQVEQTPPLEPSTLAPEPQPTLPTTPEEPSQPGNPVPPPPTKKFPLKLVLIIAGAVIIIVIAAIFIFSPKKTSYDLSGNFAPSTQQENNTTQAESQEETTEESTQLEQTMETLNPITEQTVIEAEATPDTALSNGANTQNGTTSTPKIKRKVSTD